MATRKAVLDKMLPSPDKRPANFNSSGKSGMYQLVTDKNSVGNCYFLKENGEYWLVCTLHQASGAKTFMVQNPKDSWHTALTVSTRRECTSLDVAFLKVDKCPNSFSPSCIEFGEKFDENLTTVEIRTVYQRKRIQATSQARIIDQRVL
jgi:hypothetical protein